MWMMHPRFLFDAIRLVETGGHPDATNATGDNGRTLGPYQISEPYWTDAVTHRREIGGVYDDVRDAGYAERIMMAYWDRYAPDDHAETLARIHNGGPHGHRRAGTDEYWRRVSRAMDAAHLCGNSRRVEGESANGSEGPRPSNKEATSRSAARSYRSRLVAR